MPEIVLDGGNADLFSEDEILSVYEMGDGFSARRTRILHFVQGILELRILQGKFRLDPVDVGRKGLFNCEYKCLSKTGLILERHVLEETLRITAFHRDIGWSEFSNLDDWKFRELISEDVLENSPGGEDFQKTLVRATYNMILKRNVLCKKIDLARMNREEKRKVFMSEDEFMDSLRRLLVEDC